MCLWTRLRLNISKKLKSRVLVFSLYSTAFSVVLAQGPMACHPRSFRAHLAPSWSLQQVSYASFVHSKYSCILIVL